MAFAVAAGEWRSLVAKEADADFCEAHFGSVASLAVALAKQADSEADAVDWAAVQKEFPTEEEEQKLLALVFVVQRLLEICVRDHMTFLLPRKSLQQTNTASQKDAQEQQQSVLQLLPARFLKSYQRALKHNWTALETAAHANKVSLPRLCDLQWRALPRVVLIRMETTDGQVHRMQVPLRQFHQLRYSAAKVLQEMNQVESHPIMRLAYNERSSATTSAP